MPSHRVSEQEAQAPLLPDSSGTWRSQGLELWRDWVGAWPVVAQAGEQGSPSGGVGEVGWAKLLAGGRLASPVDLCSWLGDCAVLGPWQLVASGEAQPSREFLGVSRHLAR